jgi:hypothetical protein
MKVIQAVAGRPEGRDIMVFRATARSADISDISDISDMSVGVGRAY